MTLKTLLKYVFATTYINLWDADNNHQDIYEEIKPEKIPTKYLNCKVEEGSISGKKPLVIVISIHTKK